MIGDVTVPNGEPDGKVDMRDVGLVAKYFGQTVPPAPALCDITGTTQGVPDGKIDMRDVGLVAKHFGDTVCADLERALRLCFCNNFAVTISNSSLFLGISKKYC